jgi:hypothetical protein
MKKQTIQVRAKITAGTHPVHGPIVKDQLYTIKPEQMADQLFEPVEVENKKETLAPVPTGKKRR